MTLKLFNVWVIYQINTLEHSMLSFFLILESLNEIWTSFDIFALQCYNKRQGRKLRPVWRQNTLQKRVKFVHKSSIYSQHFSLNSQFMPCSFSLCSLMKYTFSFQFASWAKSWNMTTKIAENDARTSQVDQFAVVIARPRPIFDIVWYYASWVHNILITLMNCRKHVSLSIRLQTTLNRIK